MRKTVYIVISLIMVVLLAVGVFFVYTLYSNRIEVLQTTEAIEYYINGESGFLRFGVEGNGNLFEPDKKINVVLECRDGSLNGTKAIVRITSEQTDFNKWGYVTFNSDLPYNILTFSSSKNGIFTVQIKQPNKAEYGFTVGILPKNDQANDNFYYGVQPYITRAYTWGEGFCVPGYDAEESVNKILDTAEYLGANLVREDSVGWGAMQSQAYGDVNFSVQDHLVEQVNNRGMKYNWLLGYNAGEWSTAEKYKMNYDASVCWTYPPDEALWGDFVNKIAEHYADNTDILWEIWNEPNWHFFAGTSEEYFSLLENTAKIIKSKNESAYVYSGGLAAAEKETNSEYYQKSAELIKKDLLDNFGYHNHDGLDNYYDYMTQMLTLASKSGLTDGGFNSESGIWGTDANTVACKALYTRSTGAEGFVAFAFRKTVTPENDINEYAFFNEYLQPSEAAIAYATVIRFLGNADFTGNISNEKNLVIDEYNQNGKKIEVYYSLGEKSKITAPEGDYDAYDMYGNPIGTKGKITVNTSPIYILYK